MHLTTISLTSVFGIKRSSGFGGKPAHTLFGFSSPTMKKVSVEVPGLPEVTTGDTLTILLKSPSNWTRVEGWVNHRTHELAAPNPIGSGIAAGVATAVVIWLAATAELDWRGGPIFISFLVAGMYWSFDCVRSVLVRRALNEVAASLVSTPRDEITASHLSIAKR